jgi:hypothetical protein
MVNAEQLKPLQSSRRGRGGTWRDMAGRGGTWWDVVGRGNNERDQWVVVVINGWLHVALRNETLVVQWWNVATAVGRGGGRGRGRGETLQRWEMKNAALMQSRRGRTKCNCKLMVESVLADNTSTIAW